MTPEGLTLVAHRQWLQNTGSFSGDSPLRAQCRSSTCFPNSTNCCKFSEICVTFVSIVNNMYRNIFIKSLLCALLVMAAVSCNPHKHYIIGVSQCSEDSWRGKLQSELEMASYFYDGVELRFASAHDNSEVQEHQVDSLVAGGVDMLIVSPNQKDQLSAALERAFDKGIPVVLFDRKTDSDKYTAFMGADNHRIGGMLGHFAAQELSERGYVVEICGLEGSSPAMERHNGFVDAMNDYPSIRIVCSLHGDWTRDSGYRVMSEFLRDYDGPVDCIMGGNDRMAAGALEALRQMRPDAHPIVLGVDALPGRGGGMQLVRDSLLTASAIYPTHGDELLQLALTILDGKSFNKENELKSSIVTAANANILLLQNEELERNSANIKKMSARVDYIKAVISTQQMALYTCAILILLSLIFIAVIVRANRQKQNLMLVLAQQKELAESQRDELELERDRLIEAQLALVESGKSAGTETGADVLSGNEESFRKENEFMQKFNTVVNDHMDDADFGVEQIGQVLGYSRVQLYRKVKAMTGKSPVELLRSYRLEYARKLLNDASLSVSEVAYRVGFSSPGYFSKCFREEFGTLPSENK